MTPEEREYFITMIEAKAFATRWMVQFLLDMLSEVTDHEMKPAMLTVLKRSRDEAVLNGEDGDLYREEFARELSNLIEALEG